MLLLLLLLLLGVRCKLLLSLSFNDVPSVLLSHCKKKKERKELI
jgi:hypothetical protein